VRQGEARLLMFGRAKACLKKGFRCPKAKLGVKLVPMLACWELAFG